MALAPFRPLEELGVDRIRPHCDRFQQPSGVAVVGRVVPVQVGEVGVLERERPPSLEGAPGGFTVPDESVVESAHIQHGLVQLAVPASGGCGLVFQGDGLNLALFLSLFAGVGIQLRATVSLCIWQFRNFLIYRSRLQKYSNSNTITSHDRRNRGQIRNETIFPVPATPRLQTEA